MEKNDFNICGNTVQDVVNERLQRIIGVNWKRLRLQHSMTRKDMEKYGLPFVFQGLVENGKTEKLRTTSLRYAEMLSRALGLSLEETIAELTKPVSDEASNRVDQVSGREYYCLDIYDIYPYNVFYAMFKEPFNEFPNDIKTIYHINPAIFDKNMRNLLTEREYAVIQLRFRQGMNLDEAGREYGVTRERIRQVEAKAMRRLRRYAKSNALIPVERLYSKIRTINDLKRENRQLRKKIEDLSLLLQHEGIDVSDIDKELFASNIPIDDLDLSVRAYNCLVRYGSLRNSPKMETLEDITVLSTKELKAIRNLGKRSYEEVVRVVHDHGLKFADEV